MKRAGVIAVLILLLAPVACAGQTPKPACPSLDGEWAGDFDGTFAGQWHATFNHSGANIRATADITPDSGTTIEAEGSAGTKCEDGKTAVAGTGSARGKSGSFSGVSDETGNKLSGTWWNGNAFGTWRGEKVTDEP